MTLEYVLMLRLLVPDPHDAPFRNGRLTEIGERSLEDPPVNALCADELPPLERRFATKT